MEPEEFILEKKEDFKNPMLELREYGFLLKNENYSIIVCDLREERIKPSNVLYPTFEENFNEIYYFVENEESLEKIKKIIESPNLIKRKKDGKEIYYNNGDMYSVENKALVLKKEKNVFLHRWYKENDEFIFDIMGINKNKKFNSPEECYNISVNDTGYYYKIENNNSIKVYDKNNNQVDNYETTEKMKENYQIVREPILPNFIKKESIKYNIVDDFNLKYSNNIKV